jgi:hypothetical protein
MQMVHLPAQFCLGPAGTLSTSYVWMTAEKPVRFISPGRSNRGSGAFGFPKGIPTDGHGLLSSAESEFASAREFEGNAAIRRSVRQAFGYGSLRADNAPVIASQTCQPNPRPPEAAARARIMT